MKTSRMKPKKVTQMLEIVDGLAEVPASVERKQGSATPMGNPIRQHIDVKNREEICVPC